LNTGVGVAFNSRSRSTACRQRNSRS